MWLVAMVFASKALEPEELLPPTWDFRIIMHSSLSCGEGE